MTGRRPRSIVQVTDSLSPGGAERVAVHLANDLAARGETSHLWPTRARGPLVGEVGPDVHLVAARRRGRLGLSGVRRAAAELGPVDLIHAHGTSVGAGVLLRAALRGHPALVWHDHYGLQHMAARPARLQRMAWLGGVRTVVTVTEDLAVANRRSMPRLAPERIAFLPNYPVLGDEAGTGPVALRGRPGARIVAVGNLRPQKDHATLVRAMAVVVEDDPEAHLTIVGAMPDAGVVAELRRLLSRLDLEDSVTLAGPVPSVGPHLRAADVAVLSSASEGFPLALVEYGLAGLAAVATDVGECRLIADDGRAAVLVPPGSPRALGEALAGLVGDPDRRQVLGRALRQRVEARFTRDAVLDELDRRYDLALGGRGE